MSPHQRPLHHLLSYHHLYLISINCYATSPSSPISYLLKTTTPYVILPSLISLLLEVSISYIIILKIASPSTILPSLTPHPIKTTMHHTLTHVSQLDVSPPRGRLGLHKCRVLPPSAPSAPSPPIHGDIPNYIDRFNKYVFCIVGVCK